MPSITKRICSKCNKIVPLNHNCTSSTTDKIYNKTKRVNNEFYQSSQWKKKRSYIMRIHGGLCQECLRNGITNTADVVDHIIELKDNWELRLEDSNLEPICHNCHNKKTQQEKLNRK